MRPPNTPSPAAPTPFLTGLWYRAYLWVLQSTVTYGVGFVRWVRPLPASQRPALIKRYPVRPKLKNRVFIPPSHKAGELLPLYIDVHGGGFALCHPYFDDEFCAHFANTYNILVVSLDYSKAPAFPFPVPVDDLEATIDAVLRDDSLPIDKNRVAIGGFSAGGNLAVAAVQAPSLQGRIHGLVPWYPVVEWVTTAPEKLMTRAYRSKDDVDMLKTTGPIFNWGYIKAGEELTNPRLSVCFAEKNVLPKWIFVVGAEYDMLCAEAKDMIMHFADLDDAARKEGEYEFEKGTYKWRMLRGVTHGYNQVPAKGADEEIRLKRIEESYAEAGEWLFRGPFAK
ncbi:hypothetical protein BP5796_03167 [Coleophoma crateriformis]|uniref:Alpha/beta hydrolase fold-3 domain-containing protein n=1 Tax=Coleophoma crateriformis TaxID=565419 RepID=A0A3D8SMC1_9HELO|nr:hypothetical protein BP5796_03167 [Coleophoma crateriformis]